MTTETENDPTTKDDASSESAPEKMQFQAEVSRLLDLMVNALYSNKEIFLRELISNASDACDKLRYASLTQPDLLGDDPTLKVTISVNAKKRTITVADNGVGMNRDDLVENLGTIARSGTAAFLDQMTGDESKDMGLIGQFGVGFYSSFMVADKVTVTTRRAGEDTAWRWFSEGTGEFTVEESAQGTRGTSVELHLKRGMNEYLETDRLRGIVKTYSDHIALPIDFIAGDGEAETVNAASALWTRPRKDITEEQYTEFYHHVGHAFDEPWLTLHNKAEGRIEYTNLLFVPTAAPFDLFHPDRKHGVKLYVKRVFITDDCEGLVPRWMRFLRGVVDSEDLPLNISREMLQHNPILTKIRTALVKRVLSELEKKAKKAPEEYDAFWGNFGQVVKEGVYEDNDNRDRLLGLMRAHSTHGDGLTSLADYVERMKDGQDEIFYITGDDVDQLRASPQLEGFTAKGIEVLLLSDPVDEFWLGSVPAFDEKPFKSATRGGIDLSKIAGEDGKTDDNKEDEVQKEGVGELIAAFKDALGDTVKDVRVSDRLTDSAVCLVADEGAIDMHLERLLKQHQQLGMESQKILEINPDNALIASLAERAKTSPSAAEIAEAAHLLLDQARIIEGEPVPDPAAFARRMTEAMAGALKA
jgi:molecular chaperone HtpG